MTRNFWILTLAAGLVVPVGAAEPKPLPAAAPAKVADDKDSKFEARATEAFNRGQYSLAKELFTKAAAAVKDTDAKKYAQLQDQVKACEKNIRELAAVMPVPPADVNPGPQIETAADKRKKHTPPANGQVLEIAMQELGNFEYNADKGGNIPDDVKKLSGSKVRIKGFMIPLDQADNISHFSLVPSLFACCFGQPPQVQHQVVVHTPKGKAVSYYPDEIVCEGTLKVEERKEDGYIVSVFEMDVNSVKPLAK
jgi:hypothetical protein